MAFLPRVTHACSRGQPPATQVPGGYTPCPSPLTVTSHHLRSCLHREPPTTCTGAYTGNLPPPSQVPTPGTSWLRETFPLHLEPRRSFDRQQVLPNASRDLGMYPDPLDSFQTSTKDLLVVLHPTNSCISQDSYNLRTTKLGNVILYL